MDSNQPIQSSPPEAGSPQLGVASALDGSNYYFHMGSAPSMVGSINEPGYHALRYQPFWCDQQGLLASSPDTHRLTRVNLSVGPHFLTPPALNPLHLI